MDYNLFSFNPKDFEHLVQALMQKILGNSSAIFGEGPDGARELTYEGTANFDSTQWDGYWVVQAKYKSKADDKEDDFKWIKKNYQQEIKKFKDTKRKLRCPDNYIFITNANLSAVQESGGWDKMKELTSQDKTIIRNISLIPYDALCRLLDNNRDVATTYSSFILSGDILQTLYQHLNKQNNPKEAICRFLHREFNDELNAKLIQAGDLTNQVKIEKVFIDLYATESGQINKDNETKFVADFIQDANKSCRKKYLKKQVLIGEAGAGKSTLSQFIVQLYSAFFLKNSNTTHQEERNFIKEYNTEEIPLPTCIRFPFKIVLKEYADWIKSQDSGNSVSVISYLSALIRKESGLEFNNFDLIELLPKLSFIFIFDGLDEVPTTSNRDIVVKEINYFIENELQEICDAMVLATTRPQGFSDEFSPQKFEHLKVCELTPELCLCYLERLLKQIENSQKERGRLITVLQKSMSEEITQRLMSTPLQATIMTLLVKSGGEPSHNRFHLFKDYYETIMKREKQKAVHTSVLKEHERLINEIHFKIAYNLQKTSENAQNPSAYLTMDDFSTFIKQYLKEEGYREDDIISIASKICENVTERLVFLSEVQDGKVGFVIRSMQEFFAANYFLSKTDDQIRELLDNISQNIYWRNTFLFLIGGIHANNRKGLIERTITLCEKLNGINLSPHEENTNSILKSGSWLALDILIEGTFSDCPRDLNIFGNLLQPLFEIPYINSHKKINQLPQTILKDWILEDIEKKLQNPETEQTAIGVLTLLTANNTIGSDVEKILENYWNYNKAKKESFLLNSQYQQFSPTEYDIKKTIEFINNYTPEITFRHTNIFVKSLKIAKYRKLFHPHKILEILFLCLIRWKYSFTYTQIIPNIFSFSNSELSNEDIDIKLDDDHRESITNYCSANYKTIEENSYEYKKRQTILKELIKIYKQHELNYIVSYLTFIKEPSKERAKTLICDLFNQGDFIYHFFLKKSKHLWYLNFIFERLPEFNKNTINDIIRVIDDNEFIISGSKIETIYDHLRHANFSRLQSDEFKIENIYNLIIQNNKEETALIAISSIFLDDHIFNRLDSLLDKDKELLCKASNEKNVMSDSYLRSLLFLLPNYLNQTETKNLIDSLNIHLFPNITHAFNFEIYFGKQFNEKTIKNILSILNASICLKQTSNIIYLFPIMHRDSIDTTNAFIHIDKKQFIEIEYCEQKAKEYKLISYLILCITEYDKDYLFGEIEYLYHSGSNIFAIIIQYISSYQFNRIWLEEFIVQTITKMEKIGINDNSLYGKYYEYLKTLSEKKNSDIRIEKDNQG